MAVPLALEFCMCNASAVKCSIALSNAGPASTVQCLPPDMLQISSCPSFWGPCLCYLRPELLTSLQLLHPKAVF